MSHRFKQLLQHGFRMVSTWGWALKNDKTTNIHPKCCIFHKNTLAILLGWHLIFGGFPFFSPSTKKPNPSNPLINSSHSSRRFRLCFFGDFVRINVVHSITQASISTIPTATACILESFLSGKNSPKKKRRFGAKGKANGLKNDDFWKISGWMIHAVILGGFPYFTKTVFLWSTHTEYTTIYGDISTLRTSDSSSVMLGSSVQ